MTLEDLEAFFGRLARDGSAPADAWPPGEDVEAYGLVIADGTIAPAGAYDPLDGHEIRAAMSRRAREWLRQLDVYPVIGSTNAELMTRAQQRDVDGAVCTAELQVQGRGRRGRSWTSPFGAQIAVSIGMGLDSPASGLGGLSLVVGLAVVDALEQLGIAGVALKWPNDVLLGGAKLAGVLIEMTRSRGTAVVVGIGMNVALPGRSRAGLPAAVADLSGQRARPRRSALVGKLVSSVVDFVGEFEQRGFVPFKPVFEARHEYQGRECQVLLGDRQVPGIVTGVTDDGALLLQTPQGIRTFHAGDVSLRRMP